MAKKVTNVTIPTSIVTRDFDKLEVGTDNIYESLAIISKRARQIATKNKEELSNKLSEFASSIDNLEEVFENREQIEISKYYERLPKPTGLAIEEYLDGKVMFRRPTE
ncbi:MAG TPA: DNA-directed RNA polymerase subunit omega [Cytophagales bacterium]|nr:DNA-directed RNA polymerase subunit omega [Cytophagales bacterium]